MLRFCARQWFCESICEHVFSRTEDETDRAVLNDPPNKMEADVNVFRVSMVLMILG